MFIQENRTKLKLKAGQPAYGVLSTSDDPQLAELFKSWRNQLGGEFNPKYRNWIYYPHAADEVLARLQRLDAQ